MADSVNVPSPDLIYVIQSQVNDIVDDIHTCIPARVVSYDHTKQSVNAQALVWDWDASDDETPATPVRVNIDGIDIIPIAGGTVHVGLRPPVFVNVPLMFPAGGGYRITFPVSVGDQVLLMFTERSIREWKLNGGEGTPKSGVRHGLNGGIAIPGLRAPGRTPLVNNDGGGTSTTHMSMGYDTGPQFQATQTQLRLGHSTAVQPVVLGTSLQTAITTLLALVTTWIALVPPTPPPNAAAGAAALAALTAGITSFNATWATRLSTTVLTD